jgi:hypothetical protein
MWEPRPLTPLWAFMACYRDSFTFFLTFTRRNNAMNGVSNTQKYSLEYWQIDNTNGCLSRTVVACPARKPHYLAYQDIYRYLSNDTDPYTKLQPICRPSAFAIMWFRTDLTIMGLKTEIKREAEGVWEQITEEDVWTKEWRSKRRLQKTSQLIAS